jgi:hypothetical protein
MGLFYDTIERLKHCPDVLPQLRQVVRKTADSVIVEYYVWPPERRTGRNILESVNRCWQLYIGSAGEENLEIVKQLIGRNLLLFLLNREPRETPLMLLSKGSGEVPGSVALFHPLHGKRKSLMMRQCVAADQPHAFQRILQQYQQILYRKNIHTYLATCEVFDLYRGNSYKIFPDQIKPAVCRHSRFY